MLSHVLPAPVLGIRVAVHVPVLVPSLCPLHQGSCLLLLGSSSDHKHWGSVRGHKPALPGKVRRIYSHSPGLSSEPGKEPGLLVRGRLAWLKPGLSSCCPAAQ